ncbi:MAG: ABC transporter substrate-binding protein [Acetobacteraceae bacterium]|nr:ABC transporter substrate-binding protein [Acetobacteraceae bacterium]
MRKVTGPRSNRNKGGFTRRAVGRAFAGLLVAGRARAGAPVRVGSKDDTEGALLGNLILFALRRAGFPVEDRLGLGPTRIIRTALIEGAIDIYPEYTGNGAFFFNLQTDPVWRDLQAGYERARSLDLQRNRLVWLPPAPANNTWAIALRQAFAAQNGLATMADFARWVNSGGKLLLAASAEFVESPAALPTFEAVYGFRLTASQIISLAGGNTAATLRAAAEGISGVNAAMAYSTDGALAALNMVILSDTKKAQVVYAPAPVARQAVLDAYPSAANLLAAVFRGLDTVTLQRLNARIAVDGEEAGQVARAVLKEKGLA